MLPLGDIICKFGLGLHCYAYDTQIYISMHPNPNLAVIALSTCLDEIKAWMHDNFLKLNQAKTELLFVGKPTSLLRLNISELITVNDFSKLSSQVRNLGVIFDPELIFDAHIKVVSKTAFFHLRNIARLRPSLQLPDAERLIHSFITSRLDYCNVLYFCSLVQPDSQGLPNRSIEKLQYTQNSAAPFLTHTTTCQHITPVLFDLHWLLIQARIEFKTLVLTYKANYETAPTYLCSLVTALTPAPSLHSSRSCILQQPRYKIKSIGGRAVSFAAPHFWNALSLSLSVCLLIMNLNKCDNSFK
nr:uncharacterized protein LOC129423081 [Misgurnus anguillicaudatus]XP_055035201.1 uncharacterized protein LOC129423081 [Misgurnus anguillicaudatus]XP_055035209.1 uncharacterized protein LOC129423081 [Misgurnus anguillicaudatus]